MRSFGSFFKFELKRFFTKRNIVVLVLFWIMCMYFIQTGVLQYNDVVRNKEYFQTIESIKIRRFQNYDQYGGYGFRLYFMPSVLSVFFHNSNPFTELNAQVDVGETLKIYDLYNEKKVFALKPGRWLDFSGMVFIFGSLMALFYGFDAFRRQEYLRFLSSIYGYLRVYRFMWGARVILLCLYFLFIFTSAVLLMLLSGLKFGSADIIYLLISLGVTLLMLVSFFSMGIIAAARGRFKALWMIVTWVYFVYFFPVSINTVLEHSVKGITSNYRDELSKIEVLMDFEGNAMSKAKLEKLAPLEAFLRNTPELWKLKFLLDEGERVRHRIEKVEKTEKKKTGEVDQLKRFRNWLSTQLKEEKETVGQSDVFQRWLFARKMGFSMGLGKAEGGQKERLQAALDIVSELECDIGFVKGEWLNKLLHEYHRLETMRDEVADRLLEKYGKTAGIKIGLMESELQSKIRSRIDIFFAVSALMPSTFYLALNNEISSRGYQSFVAFHNYAEKTKRHFIQFHTKKRRQEFDAKRSGDRVRVESFIQGDANIFTGEIHWHWTFSLGFCYILVWNLLFWRLSVLQFRKLLFPSNSGDTDGPEKLDADYKPGEVHVVVSDDRVLSEHLFKTFYLMSRGGEERLSGESERFEFVYLCNPIYLPGDIETRAFFNFLSRLSESGDNDIEKRWNKIDERFNLKERGIKYINDMTGEEKGSLFLEAIGTHGSRRRLYLMNDLTLGLYNRFVEELKEWIDLQKRHGASIYYITSDRNLSHQLSDSLAFKI